MSIRTRRKRGSTLQLLLMLVILIVIVILIIWWPVPASAAVPAQAPQEQADRAIVESTLVRGGDMAPDFRVEMLSGEHVALSSLRGKVVLLNFWATWCPPCREELSHVQAEIIDRFKDKPFVFLPVSRGEQRKTVERFISQTGYKFDVALDPSQEVYRKYATNYIPRNFLIGADGRVLYVSVGYDEADFKELIANIADALQ
ncbi:MAG: TlpA family protein disulfide reductase [Alistipes sp.]|nr:TlpA family protein disulfide reductase [Alistipes sp.]MDE7128866.1 TlpA family protein disulfide reductase [Alistipes sp.]